MLYLSGHLWEYLMEIPGQSTKLNVYQSVFIPKLPNLMTTEYIAIAGTSLLAS